MTHGRGHGHGQSNAMDGNGMIIGGGGGSSSTSGGEIGHSMDNSSSTGKPPPAKQGKRSTSNIKMTDEEKKQLNRDRNRQHARSIRLHKKAYVNKLKEKSCCTVPELALLFLGLTFGLVFDLVDLDWINNVINGTNGTDTDGRNSDDNTTLSTDDNDGGVEECEGGRGGGGYNNQGDDSAGYGGIWGTGYGRRGGGYSGT